MSMNPKITIVMPAYGVEKYISAAIESVLSQDFQDWELLVVLDGSKDRSGDIARKYAGKDSRIFALNKENGGLSDARNYGLDRAKGEYVHFFDSDDLIEPDFYSRMYSAIASNDKDLVICGYVVDSVSGDRISHTEHQLFDCPDPVPAKYDLKVVGEYVNYAWNKLFLTAFLRKNGLFFQKGLVGYEDAEFMSRYMLYRPRVMFVQYVGYHYYSRQRVTLSRLFDENVVKRTADSLCCYRDLMNCFSDDRDKIECEFSRAVLGGYKALFPLVLENNRDSLKSVRWVLQEDDLNSLLPKSYKGGIQDRVFLLLLRFRLSVPIFLYYKLR